MGPRELEKNQAVLTANGNFFRVAADLTFYASQLKCSLGYIQLVQIVELTVKVTYIVKQKDLANLRRTNFILYALTFIAIVLCLLVMPLYSE
jgi:hypothetical protein